MLLWLLPQARGLGCHWLPLQLGQWFQRALHSAPLLGIIFLLQRLAQAVGRDQRPLCLRRQQLCLACVPPADPSRDAGHPAAGAGETEPSRGSLLFAICSAVLKAPRQPKEEFGEVRGCRGSACSDGYAVGWERGRERECVDLQHDFTAAALDIEGLRELSVLEKGRLH